jgi:hypothetical protein
MIELYCSRCSVRVVDLIRGKVRFTILVPFQNITQLGSLYFALQLVGLILHKLYGNFALLRAVSKTSYLWAVKEEQSNL